MPLGAVSGHIGTKAKQDYQIENRCLTLSVTIDYAVTRTKMNLGERAFCASLELSARVSEANSTDQSCK